MNVVDAGGRGGIPTFVRSLSITNYLQGYLILCLISMPQMSGLNDMDESCIFNHGYGGANHGEKRKGEKKKVNQQFPLIYCKHA
jgi:hypothetical protein